MTRGVDVRLLGPLEVRVNGAPRSVGGRRVKGALALLALSAGEAVSQDRMIDVLWGDEPTSTAATGVHVAISKLRKALADAPSVRILTRGNGYIADVDPDAIDVHRFGRLIEAAKQAIGRGDADEARRCLDTAIDLWRGEPLADVELPGLDPAVITGLHAQLAAARIARLEALLALGEIVPAAELDELLSADPMNERVAALAATALYRAGRPSDALETIADLRRALAADLGVDPGPAIAALESQILNRDASLLGEPDDEGTTSSRSGRKTITAVVATFSVVSSRSAAPDPEAALPVVDDLRAQARSAVERVGGRMLPLTGGGLAAVFGVPRVREDDVARAVAAATSIGELASPPGALEVEVRVGVATGAVLVQDTDEDELLLSEGPVEVAGQLARAARAAEVLVANETARLSSDVLEATDMIVLADGGPAMAASRMERSDHPSRRRSPLVGRDDELAQLQAMFERTVRERTCSLVTVLGDAGIGKSRLVEAFLDRTRDARILRGRCLSYGRDLTYWPIVEIIRAATGIRDGDGRTRIKRRISSLLSGLDDATFVTDELLALFDADHDAPPALEELFWSVRRALEAVAASGPTIVHLDDAQWADATLLDLIEHVAMWSTGAPLLIVVTSRPELVEIRKGWGGGRLDATTITLEPFSTDEAQRFLTSVTGDGALSASAVSRILTLAEGNPLFLREALSMALEDRAEGRSAGSVDPVIPPTVQLILEARLDRLRPSDRRTLERAAIVGREFGDGDLRSLTPPEEQDGLTDSLSTLRDRDLITLERVGRDGRTYAFRHILIRDTAETGTPKQIRAADHRAFGEALESKAGDRFPELEGIIGYHQETAYRLLIELGTSPDDVAILRRAAADHLATAGRRAAALGDAAAASVIGRAVTLMDADDPEVPELRRLQASALMNAGDLEGADTALQIGLATAEKIGDVGAAWRLRIEQADLAIEARPEEHDAAASERLAAEAIEALEEIGDVAGQARAERFLGDTLIGRGHQREAEQVYARARRHARESGNSRELAEAASGGGAIGSLPAEQCLLLLDDAVAGSDRPNPNLQSVYGVVLAMLDRGAEARATLDGALERATELGAELWADSIRMYFGLSLLLGDDPAGTEAVVRPAVESLRRIGAKAFLSSAAHLLAEAVWRQGRPDEAMLVTAIAEDASAPDDVAAEMGWRGVRAKVLADRGEAREAERLAHEGARLGNASDFLLFAGWANEDLAYVLARTGKLDEARRARETARSLYERKGSVASLRQLDALAAD